jgi:hypothetical protein
LHLVFDSTRGVRYPAAAHSWTTSRGVEGLAL